MSERRELRVGHGFDVHAFAANRKLILGGVEIDYHLGLAGHSDADVLLHALTDAVCGALGWGDIGTWFPDSDEGFRDAASSSLFSAVWGKAQMEGWSLINCDCVVMAQEPKLGPYVLSIQQKIAELFSAPPNRVGIKATTTERLGFVGRGEGIAASAVVLLESNSQ